VASALLLITGGALAALRESPPARAAMARGALMIAAIAFGASARWIMAPSAGSWDMEYWRAWTESTAARGLTGAYGPPLADGAFLPTLRGDTELWMVAIAPQNSGDGMSRAAMTNATAAPRPMLMRVMGSPRWRRWSRRSTGRSRGASSRPRPSS
jgi:hypothetical protein